MSDTKAFFEEKLPEKFKADPSRAEGMDGKYQFAIEGEGTWVVDVADGAMNVCAGECDDAGCTLKCTAEDWGAILGGELEPTTAFMSGKLLIEGDMAMAMKLQPILGDI